MFSIPRFRHLYLLDVLPIVYHHLRDALQGVALQFRIVVLDQRHRQLLRAEPLRDRPPVGIVTAEFADVEARYRGHVLVLARHEGDEYLDQLEVPVLPLHHLRVLLEEGVGVGGSPLQLSRLDLVLVNLPTRHLLEVVHEQPLECVDVVDYVRIRELPLAEQADRLHEPARDHLPQEGPRVDAGYVRLRVRVRRAGREVPQGREGDAHDLLPRRARRQLDERRDREAVLREVGAHVREAVELVREAPQAEREFVQLLHGRVGRARRRGRGGRARRRRRRVLARRRRRSGSAALPQLAGEVLDPPGRREDLPSLRGAHEGHDGGYGGADGDCVGTLELRYQPRGESLQRLYMCIYYYGVEWSGVEEEEEEARANSNERTEAGVVVDGGGG